MQAALDAAVLAGAAKPDGTPVSERIAAAQLYFDNNVSRFGRAAASGMAAQFTASDSAVSGKASAQVANPFGGVTGSANLKVGVKATATRQLTQLCILGLNISDNGAMDMNGNVRMTAPTCAVPANSKSTSGLTQEGQLKAVAKIFSVAGGHKGNNFTQPPIDNSAAIPDPYKSIPFPIVGVCDSSKKDRQIKDDATLSPSTYCGGIRVFGNGTKVTLEPGVYIMQDGPFWIDASSTVTGNEVVIALTGKGAALQIWGNSTVTLTSPKSGTYASMQFMQDRDDPNSHAPGIRLVATRSSPTMESHTFQRRTFGFTATRS